MVSMYDVVVSKVLRNRMHVHGSLFYCQIYLFQASSPLLVMGVHLSRDPEVCDCRAAVQGRFLVIVC